MHDCDGKQSEYNSPDQSDDSVMLRAIQEEAINADQQPTRSPQQRGET
jgi:hypothetical protein